MRLARLMAVSVLTLTLVTIFNSQVSAQGGWRQWQIKFLDGTSVEASPLQMRADGKFTRSMDPKEPGFDRSKISYFAIVARDLPPVPEGSFKKDLVVMMDGTRSFGAVKFLELRFSEGKILQNGKEMSLEKVAYIKFARTRGGGRRSK